MNPWFVLSPANAVFLEHSGKHVVGVANAFAPLRYKRCERCGCQRVVRFGLCQACGHPL